VIRSRSGNIFEKLPELFTVISATLGVRLRYFVPQFHPPVAKNRGDVIRPLSGATEQGQSLRFAPVIIR
jgi:hypothetical protein